jgi:hypothetical protein
MTGPDGALDWADGPDAGWLLDSAAGPVVRPYALTRAPDDPSRACFDLLAFVTTVQGAAERRRVRLLPEHRAILSMARDPASVAELAADLDLAVGVVRFLLADLVGGGLVTIQDPPADDQPDSHLLKAVINGLRAL